MDIYCEQCGKEMPAAPLSANGVLPDGWQITLSDDGEHWLCSHACAGAWHEQRAWRDETRKSTRLAVLGGTVPVARQHVLAGVALS
jgi:hypothetical protein